MESLFQHVNSTCLFGKNNVIIIEVYHHKPLYCTELYYTVESSKLIYMHHGSNPMFYILSVCFNLVLMPLILLSTPYCTQHGREKSGYLSLHQEQSDILLKWIPSILLTSEQVVYINKRQVYNSIHIIAHAFVVN